MRFECVGANAGGMLNEGSRDGHILHRAYLKEKRRVCTGNLDARKYLLVLADGALEKIVKTTETPA